MPKVFIKADGRTLVDQNTKNLPNDNSVQTLKYDDGTVLRITVNGGDVNVECNKKIEMLPDGYTVKILD